MFHTSVIDAIAKNGWIKEVVAVSGSYQMRLNAKYYIDTTGEGDGAFLAGADFDSGIPENGRTLHMSLTAMFYDTGIKRKNYLPPGYEPIYSVEDLPGLRGPVRLADNRRYANMTKIMWHDPTNPLSFSQAEQESRRQLVRINYYVQTLKPTYALISSGQKIGIREGCCILGEYRLTQEDILGEISKDFPDGVAVATTQNDFHSLSKPGHTGWRQDGQPYSIPFRAMIPQGFSNLIVAGKPISSDQIPLLCYRMITTVCVRRQAAGTAVVLALEKECLDIHKININSLLDILTKDGMELNPANYNPFASEPTPNLADAV
jgi:hypothetical protein